ncbi:putative chalcone synthase [Shouchella clausii]|uniref:type III polyketide synthase n=1 Tax=Shouchella tritolerans TaxID=2979466 RepID=UPI001B2E0944|nr:3-oxoacyl-[acyl-carrier-protein] synthase III C-terminal domain-containing protein [Shouchella tritolerans]GIN14242.1 putative chalcone synthase [Shouchella clausii]
MPTILSVSTYDPPHPLKQEQTVEFARELFAESFSDIERLLNVFANGEIEKRHFSVPLEWFQTSHRLGERNDLFIEKATDYSVEAVNRCLDNGHFLSRTIAPEEIDAIIFVSSSGMATPSIDARIMNKLPFRPETKRLPIWGLGCAGGAAGLSRAYDYCLAHPKKAVLVVCAELCGLTFQKEDQSKSNLIGTSLFADGVACALVAGHASPLLADAAQAYRPVIRATQSVLMPDSEDVMGWDVRDNGLNVIFSRHIPTLVAQWLKPNVEELLRQEGKEIGEINAFIAHPGGKKVLEAYEIALGFPEEMTLLSRKVLKEHGNMSSPTVLYVLKESMGETHKHGDVGLVAALGPGFCSEMLVLEWAGGLH